VTPLSTIMATVANGDPIPNYFTIVDPPTIRGNTMVQSKLNSPCVFHAILMVSQCGTLTAVETAITNQKTQWFHDQCNSAMHHDEPSPPFSPPDTLPFTKTSHHVATIMPSKVILDAIKWMLCSNLRDYLPHPLDKTTPTANLSMLPMLDIASSLTSITKSHVDLDAIKQAIHCSLCEDFPHLPPNNPTIADDQSSPPPRSAYPTIPPAPTISCFSAYQGPRCT